MSINLHISKPMEKGRILTHVCFIMGMHRKAVVRRFGELQRYDPWEEQGKPGRSLLDNQPSGFI